jgi:hypothetical protein
MCWPGLDLDMVPIWLARIEANRVVGYRTHVMKRRHQRQRRRFGWPSMTR